MKRKQFENEIDNEPFLVDGKWNGVLSLNWSNQWTVVLINLNLFLESNQAHRERKRNQMPIHFAPVKDNWRLQANAKLVFIVEYFSRLFQIKIKR